MKLIGLRAYYKEIKGKNPHVVINNMLLINPEPKALKEKGLDYFRLPKSIGKRMA